MRIKEMLRMLLQGLRSPYAVWVVLIIDGMVLLWGFIEHPRFMDSFWAKVVVLAVAAKSLLVFLGIVENDRLKRGENEKAAGAYEILHKGLSNGFVWSAVMLISVVFWVFMTTLNARLVINVQSKERPSYALEVTDLRAAPSRSVFNAPHLDTPFVSVPVEVYGIYSVKVTPDSANWAQIDSTVHSTRFGVDTIVVPLQPRQYAVRFILNPKEARLTLKAGGVDTLVNQSGLIRLTHGTYDYVAEMDTRYVPLSKSLNIPDGLEMPYCTKTLTLLRRMAQVKFLANRGLGKFMEVAGVVELTKGDSAFVQEVETGTWVTLPVGERYSAKAIARERMDPRNRKYVGKKDIGIDTLAHRVIVIPVHEEWPY